MPTCAAEIGARALYQEAATYCHSVKDYVSRDLFEQLMKDEEHHIDFLETQIDLVNRIGVELYQRTTSANSTTTDRTTARIRVGRLRRRQVVRRAAGGDSGQVGIGRLDRRLGAVDLELRGGVAAR